MNFKRGLQRFAPNHRVLFHNLELLRRQRTGLQQNPIGYSHLANIMQRAGHIDQLNIIVVDLIVKFSAARDNRR